MSLIEKELINALRECDEARAELAKVRGCCGTWSGTPGVTTDSGRGGRTARAADVPRTKAARPIAHCLPPWRRRGSDERKGCC